LQITISETSVFLQLMAVLVCGQHGQLAVKRVELDPSREVEPAPILFPPIKDKIAPGNTIRQRAVN